MDYKYDKPAFRFYEVLISVANFIAIFILEPSYELSALWYTYGK
jgi:hypothetical protein